MPTDTFHVNTTAELLIEGVALAVATDDKLPLFDPPRHQERSAFVDVLDLLEWLGVIRPVDCPGEYRVDRMPIRRLAGPSTMEETTDPWHSVMRSLVDVPLTLAPRDQLARGPATQYELETKTHDLLARFTTYRPAGGAHRPTEKGLDVLAASGLATRPDTTARALTATPRHTVERP